MDEAKDYYVWHDNLFQELFAMEVQEMSQYPLLLEQLRAERNVLHTVKATSTKKAFEIFHAQYPTEAFSQTIASPKNYH